MRTTLAVHYNEDVSSSWPFEKVVNISDSVVGFSKEGRFPELLARQRRALR